MVGLGRMRLYNLRGEIRDVIKSERWELFPPLWAELIDNSRLATVEYFGVKGMIPDDRFIHDIAAGHPKYVVICNPDKSPKEYFENIFPEFNDPYDDGGLCVGLSIGLCKKQPLIVKIFYQGADICDLREIYEYATKSCDRDVLSCLYTPSLSLVIKAFQNLRSDFPSDEFYWREREFILSLLESCKSAYVHAIQCSDTEGLDKLINLIDYIPDIGPYPAIQAFQSLNFDATVLLFSGLSKIYPFHTHDYESIHVEDRSVFDFSRKLPEQIGHKHQNFVEAQCFSLKSLLPSKYGDRVDLNQLTKLSSILLDEIREFGGSWLVSERFVRFAMSPFWGIADLLKAIYQRLGELQPMSFDRLSHEFEAVDRLSDYVILVVRLVIEAGDENCIGRCVLPISSICELNSKLKLSKFRGSIYEDLKSQLDQVA